MKARYKLVLVSSPVFSKIICLGESFIFAPSRHIWIYDSGYIEFWVPDYVEPRPQIWDPNLIE